MGPWWAVGSWVHGIGGGLYCLGEAANRVLFGVRCGLASPFCPDGTPCCPGRVATWLVIAATLGAGRVACAGALNGFDEPWTWSHSLVIMYDPFGNSPRIGLVVILAAVSAHVPMRIGRTDSSARRSMDHGKKGREEEVNKFLTHMNLQQYLASVHQENVISTMAAR